jgi:Flp pilus assembly protein protease CpaA
MPMVDGVWMSESALVFVLLFAWLTVCAGFDWRKGEVPNWLTLPGMLGGILYAAVLRPERLLFVCAAFAILFILFLLNGIGGADVKVLTGLAGFWPAMMVAALLVQGIWGLIVLIRKGRGAEFRAIPAYALGAALSALFLF